MYIPLGTEKKNTKIKKEKITKNWESSLGLICF